MSLDRLLEHRRLWGCKPVLERVYAVWFDLLLDPVARGGRVLEVGSGPGFLRPYARRKRADLQWTASDLVPAPWNDIAADAHRLPLQAAKVSTIVGLDVLHHLADPAAFFREVARVLAPGGSLVLVEPWLTPLSYPIYRWFHQERCTLGLEPWRPFGEAAKDAFEGDAAIPWLLVRRTEADAWARLGLEPPLVRTLSGFAYLLSLGFRNLSLLPRALAPFALALDRLCQPLAPIFGMRALVVWRRAGSGPS